MRHVVVAALSVVACARQGAAAPRSQAPQAGDIVENQAAAGPEVPRGACVDILADAATQLSAAGLAGDGSPELTTTLAPPLDVDADGTIDQWVRVSCGTGGCRLLLYLTRGAGCGVFAGALEFATLQATSVGAFPRLRTRTEAGCCAWVDADYDATGGIYRRGRSRRCDASSGPGAPPVCAPWQ
jgi:hypothetical protein